jgi:formylglycine-generating enzyme required for sulfatase activity
MIMQPRMIQRLVPQTRLRWHCSGIGVALPILHPIAPKVDSTRATHVSVALVDRATTRWFNHDILGNVWKWCDDRCDRNFYQSSPQENPHNTAGTSDRLLRGGGWCVYPRRRRPALRIRRTPEYRYYDFRFRVATVQE